MKSPLFTINVDFMHIGRHYFLHSYISYSMSVLDYVQIYRFSLELIDTIQTLLKMDNLYNLMFL